MHSSSSSTDGFNEVPISLEDPDYKGLELDVICEKHGNAAERLVAFEGIYTGRRFLACAEPNAEFTKFEEKHSQEKLELKFQVADLLKGNEKRNEEKYMLEFKIVELMKTEEELKGIQAILQS
ncbi:hypothetical protein ZWY2020_054809 [Hordeum vulgare]|nr:hypothetical protein ZWY2020_054809 [Hordeum vulgare]